MPQNDYVVGNDGAFIHADISFLFQTVLGTNRHANPFPAFAVQGTHFEQLLSATQQLHWV